MKPEGLASLDGVAEAAERRLVRHYLRTDGAFGAGPLTYLDATRDELGTALELEPEDAVIALMEACGGGNEIAKTLAHGWNRPWRAPDSPGFFRYLVLTCAVVASADENPETQDFGANLQKLCGAAHKFPVRRGLPGLWRRLALWVDHARERGLELRRVVLPLAEQRHKHIGTTNAVTFPGWQDIKHLRVTLHAMPSLAARIRRPDEAARALDGKVTETHGFRPQMALAAKEYGQLYREKASLLGLHRFWAVVQRALRTTSPRLADAGRMQAELVVGAVPGTARLDVSWRARDGGPHGNTGAELRLALDDAMVGLRSWGLQRAKRAATPLCEALQLGVVPFVAERFGVLAFDARRPEPLDRLAILVSATKVGRAKPIRDRLRQLTEKWSLLGPFDGIEARAVLEALGYPLDAQHWNPLTVEGGVRSRLGWLGRPSLLPALSLEGKGHLTVVPVQAGDAPVTLVRRRAGMVELVSPVALQGQYVARVEDGASGRDLAFERRLAFVARAPEHERLGRPGEDWFEPEEVTEAAWHTTELSLDADAFDRSPGDVMSGRFGDFLEALYVRAATGIDATEFVQLATSVLDGPPWWDVARSLQECGWIRHTVSRRWRASRYWLQPPSLLAFTIDDRPAVSLIGAAPERVRERFAATAVRLGGRIVVQAGVGAWSPTSSIALDVEAATLALELGWPLERPRLAADLHAPSCWATGADGGRHTVSERWDSAAGRFVGTEPPRERAELDRRRRREGDRPDVFVVSTGGRTVLETHSQAAAFAEMQRLRGQPAFECRARDIVRSGSRGYLPIQVARTLYLGTFRAPGPVREADRWRYAYPSQRFALTRAIVCLGERFFDGAVVQASHGGARLSPRSLALARHRGARSGLSVDGR